MALVKNWQFFHIFTIGKKDKENVFKSVQERKKAFPDYRNNKLKKSKISDYSMDLVKNWQFFHPLIIGEIGQENVFEYIRERKKAFPDYKNNKLKKPKIWNFAKGVSPWFSLKIGKFSIF